MSTLLLFPVDVHQAATAYCRMAHVLDERAEMLPIIAYEAILMLRLISSVASGR
jgi:hypothetical protein